MHRIRRQLNCYQLVVIFTGSLWWGVVNPLVREDPSIVRVKIKNDFRTALDLLNCLCNARLLALHWETKPRK